MREGETVYATCIPHQFSKKKIVFNFGLQDKNGIVSLAVVGQKVAGSATYMYGVIEGLVFRDDQL